MICASDAPLAMNSLWSCKRACGPWVCTPGCSFACCQRGHSSAKTQETCAMQL